MSCAREMISKVKTICQKDISYFRHHNQDEFEKCKNPMKALNEKKGNEKKFIIN